MTGVAGVGALPRVPLVRLVPRLLEGTGADVGRLCSSGCSETISSSASWSEGDLSPKVPRPLTSSMSGRVEGPGLEVPAEDPSKDPARRKPPAPKEKKQTDI